MRVTLACLMLTGCQLVFDVEPDPLDPRCPDKYELIDGLSSRYRFESNSALRLPWNAAASSCAVDQVPDSSRFTHLIVLDNELENIQIVQSGRLDLTTATWLGLEDARVEGTFEWITDQPQEPPYPDQPDDTPWNSGEPNDSGTGEDCVSFDSSTGVFNDSNCPSMLAYICECDAFAIADR